MRINALLITSLVAAAFVVGGNGSASAEAQSGDTQAPTKVNVAPGDSLSKIAEAHATTYVRLYDANLNVEHPDVIHPGEEIRVPAADEQLSRRPLPQAAPAPPPVTPVKPVATPAPVVQQPRQVQPEPVVAETASAGVWDRLAQCESGGNWSINTGNGYYGGLQFSLSSWRAVGGSGYPHQASKSEQIARAEMLKARQGWGAWPACTAKLGLR